MPALLEACCRERYALADMLTDLALLATPSRCEASALTPFRTPVAAPPIRVTAAAAAAPYGPIFESASVTPLKPLAAMSAAFFEAFATLAIRDPAAPEEPPIFFMELVACLSESFRPFLNSSLLRVIFASIAMLSFPF